MGRLTLAARPSDQNVFSTWEHRGVRHVYECPMRWADMDQLAHINNVTYFDYLQEARVDFGRHIGLAATADVGLVVARSELQFRAPLTFRHTPVKVAVTVTDVRAASFTLGYEIYDETPDGPVVYATAHTVLTPYVFAEERIRRLTPEERASLQPYVVADADPMPAFVGVPVPRRPENHYAVHVRFSDIDGYGHVNNIRYVEYLQEARIALISRLFREVPGRRGRVAMVVASIDIEYKRQLTVAPEPYDAHTRVTDAGRSSMVLVTDVLDRDGSVAARGRVVLVFFDPETQRSTPPPDDIREIVLRAAAEV